MHTHANASWSSFVNMLFALKTDLWNLSELRISLTTLFGHFHSYLIVVHKSPVHPELAGLWERESDLKIKVSLCDGLLMRATLTSRCLLRESGQVYVACLSTADMVLTFKDKQIPAWHSISTTTPPEKQPTCYDNAGTGCYLPKKKEH